jgi:hypothetical protein
MNKIRNYIKRLNWFGFFVTFSICGAGALARQQDATLFDSLMVWLIIGLPMSLIILFVGMEPKNN